MAFYNYVVPSLASKLDQGHIEASELSSKIINHDGSEAYHSMFDMEKRQSFTGYRGPHRPAMGWVIFDFDGGKTEAGFDLKKAASDCNLLYSALQLNTNFTALYFSGRAGFHLYVREEFFGVPHDEHCSSRYAAIASEFKKKYELSTLDDGIYSANHKIRMPGSCNPKSNGYKLRLPGNESFDSFLARGNKYTKNEPRDLAFNLFTERYEGSRVSESVVPEDFGMGGAIDAPLQDGELFKKFEHKVCVRRMWEAKLTEGERHSVAGILISDMYHTGMTEADAEVKMRHWANTQGVSERFEKEFLRMITEQWGGRRDYSYGCYHNIKKKFCSGTCELYVKLNHTKRATVEDAPKEQTQLVGSEQLPTERSIAHSVLRGFEGRIVKQEKDLFIYRDTHWVEAAQFEIDAIKERLFVSLGKKAKSKDMESAFKTFVHIVRAVPAKVNLYAVNPLCANFKNGTLWITRKGGNYSLEFKQHNADDFLTTCLDVEYTPHVNSVNTKFNDFLNHLTMNDAESADKIRALKQIAGAMLMPRFPQIFFMLGESGSGKSTFVKLFYRLIGGSKVSGFVQPRDMHGFHLEGLIHKTINIHTDVDEHEKIPDSFFKASGDRIPVQINRKGRKVVQSMLPAVHVFCANTLPPTQVKNQNVYNRRMVILKFDNVVAKVIDQFEDLVFELNTQALVEFALEGLKDIVASGGVYFKPESSKALTKSWQAMGSDPLADFIDDVSHDEVKELTIDKEQAIERNRLFVKFEQWAIESGFKVIPYSRAVLYRNLEARGFKLKKVKGERMIEGFGNLGGSSAPQSQGKDNF